MNTINQLSRLPYATIRILIWRRPALSMGARLELIRLLFVDALRG
jgi:hypothetical protein